MKSRVLLACASAGLTLLSTFPATAAGTAASASDWPKLHGPKGDGTSAETGLLKTWDEDGPLVTWTVETGPGYGGAAVSGNEVYFLDREMGEGDVLRCLDLDSGEEIWSYTYEAPGRLQFPGSRMVPTVTEEYVYTLGGFGDVYCFDRVLQEPAWHVHLVNDLGGQMPAFGYSQMPLVHEDLVIVSPMGEESGLVALDRITGDEVWRTEALGSTQGSPVLITLGGRTQVLIGTQPLRPGGAGFGGAGGPGGGFGGGFGGGRRGGGQGGGQGGDGGQDGSRPPRGTRFGQRPGQEGGEYTGPEETGFGGGGTFTALDPATGEVLWTADAQGTANIVAPMPVDDTHFLMTAQTTALFELDQKEGTFELKAAFNARGGSSLHPPMLYDGHLYLISGGGGGFGGGARGGGRGASGRLVCMDLEGKEIWRSGEDLPGYGTGNVLLADGTLYIQDGHTGALRVVKPTPEGYQLLAEADLFGLSDQRGDQQCWSPMALSDGRLLIRSQEELKCVDLRADADRP